MKLHDHTSAGRDGLPIQSSGLVLPRPQRLHCCLLQKSRAGDDFHVRYVARSIDARIQGDVPGDMIRLSKGRVDGGHGLD
jgi:hypothetical protein